MQVNMCGIIKVSNVTKFINGLQNSCVITWNGYIHDIRICISTIVHVHIHVCIYVYVSV